MGSNSGGSYKLIGQVIGGDQVEIRTDSRENARHYASVMMLNPIYTVVQVEAQGQVYIGEAIGRMP